MHRWRQSKGTNADTDAQMHVGTDRQVPNTQILVHMHTHTDIDTCTGTGTRTCTDKGTDTCAYTCTNTQIHIQTHFQASHITHHTHHIHTSHTAHTCITYIHHIHTSHTYITYITYIHPSFFVCVSWSPVYNSLHLHLLHLAGLLHEKGARRESCRHELSQRRPSFAIICPCGFYLFPRLVGSCSISIQQIEGK